MTGLLILAVLAGSVATPSSEPTVSPWSASSSVPRGVAGDTTLTKVRPSWRPEVAAAAAPSTVHGQATFYCRPGEQGTPACTHGYGPDDLVAAIDRKDSPFDKGDRVRVTHGSRSVVVTIVDVCACAGARVIDMTSGAFRRLAPLSRGVISVTLAAASSALPRTDRLARLPDTSTEEKP